jgi:hypothetical protein
MLNFSLDVISTLSMEAVLCATKILWSAQPSSMDIEDLLLFFITEHLSQLMWLILDDPTSDQISFREFSHQDLSTQIVWTWYKPEFSQRGW